MEGKSCVLKVPVPYFLCFHLCLDVVKFSCVLVTPQFVSLVHVILPLELFPLNPVLVRFALFSLNFPKLWHNDHFCTFFFSLANRGVIWFMEFCSLTTSCNQLFLRNWWHCHWIPVWGMELRLPECNYAIVSSQAMVWVTI